MVWYNYVYKMTENQKLFIFLQSQNFFISIILNSDREINTETCRIELFRMVAFSTWKHMTLAMAPAVESPKL